jgi:hypothetical protein
MAGGTIMKATVDHALMRGLVPPDEIPVVHHPDRAEPDTQIIASLWDYRFGTQLPGRFLRGGKRKATHESHQKPND